MPVFDDSVRGTHPEDYMLLHDGHIHFYRHQWALERLHTNLTTLGYTLFNVDLSACTEADAVRGAVISAVPGWPPGYGQGSWPGFTDGLTDYLLHTDRSQLVLTITGWDQTPRSPASPASALLDHLAAAGQWHLLFGRRLICLLQTDDPDLEIPPLAAEHVLWNRHEWPYKYRRGERTPPGIEPTAPN